MVDMEPRYVRETFAPTDIVENLPLEETTPRASRHGSDLSVGSLFWINRTQNTIQCVLKDLP